MIDIVGGDRISDLLSRLKAFPYLRLGAAAIAAIAICGMASRAEASCSAPVSLPAGVTPGTLNPAYNTWGPSALCGAASAGTSITSAITTLDIAFLTQSSAFVGSPNNPVVDQLGGGVWIRGVGGQNTVSATGSATPSGIPGSAFGTNSESRMNFSGFQAGTDLGRFNLGASGINVVVGITGGLLDADDTELAGPGSYRFMVPFVGGYAAVTKGNFFADVQVRGDFYSISATNANLGLTGASFNGNAITVTSSAGYKFDIGSYFIEPSVGVIWSNLNLGSLAVPGGAPPTPGTCCVPPGTLSFNAIESLIGRAGVRVGTTFQTGGLGWQPFVTASVWDEFAPNAISTFTPTGMGFALDTSTTRVGTFGQFGVGTAAQLLNTGWLGYVRADYRTGDNIQGWDLTGGIRYQFTFGAPPPLVTKN